MVQTVPTFKLSNGAEFPLLGFGASHAWCETRANTRADGQSPMAGTWQAPDEEVKKAVAVALKAGYRHLDLAKVRVLVPRARTRSARRV